LTERFRSHSEEKLAKLAKLDGKVSRIDVEVCEEHNPRLAGQRSRIELTCRTRGPVVRAEAAAADPYAALDLAFTRLEARLRRAADRRRVHHGIRTPHSDRDRRSRQHKPQRPSRSFIALLQLCQVAT